jgi:hypothetical protein
MPESRGSLSKENNEGGVPEFLHETRPADIPDFLLNPDSKERILLFHQLSPFSFSEKKGAGS